MRLSKQLHNKGQLGVVVGSEHCPIPFDAGPAVSVPTVDQLHGISKQQVTFRTAEALQVTVSHNLVGLAVDLCTVEFNSSVLLNSEFAG